MKFESQNYSFMGITTKTIPRHCRISVILQSCTNYLLTLYSTLKRYMDHDRSIPCLYSMSTRVKSGEITTQ